MRIKIAYGLLFFLGLLFCASLAETSVNDEALDVHYIIPATGCHLFYAASRNGEDYAGYVISWQEAGPGKYKRVCYHAGQATDYDLYQLAAGKIIRLESGFAIQQSEYHAEIIIAGEDIVAVSQKPGFSWSGTYITKDSWNNMCKTTTNRKFAGYEMINVLGREKIAARIVVDSRSEVLHEEALSGWGYVHATQRSDEWYAAGIGLVKKITHIHTDAGTDDFTVELTQALDQDGNQLKYRE